MKTMNILVACPPNYVTGGVELLHQLTHQLNKSAKISAKIWYIGRGLVDPQPSVYESYGNSYEVTEIPSADSILIFPEIWVTKANSLVYSTYRKVIYWESVDNYLAHTPKNVQFVFPKGTIHLAQSQYALEFLREHKVADETDIIYVTDYLNYEYFMKNSPKTRKKQVLYNPSKGMEITQRVIEALPDISFVPIQGLTTTQVRELMEESMIYMDFGHHPGKDRLPRESAMCGCCVITSKKGSAQFFEDVPIYDEYKYDTDNLDFAKLNAQICQIFANFENKTTDFDFYREQIWREYDDFVKGVAQLVNRLDVPRFSIIIPAHNSAKFIRKGLDSIKSQTFKDYELIVICDNCTDDTQKVAEEYGAITEKVGFGRDGLTRNRGLEWARGEWVMFMDDDDWWLHEYVLEQIDEKLKERSDIDVLCFSFIFKGRGYASPTSNNGKHWIATWSKCWRREFIKGCKFSSESMSSDATFNRMVMAKKPRLVDWDMPMYYYNFLREGSQTERDYTMRKQKG